MVYPMISYQNFHYFHRREFLGQSPSVNRPIFKDLKVMLFFFKMIGLFPMYERINRYSIGMPSKTKIFYMHFARGILILFSILMVYLVIKVNIFKYTMRESKAITFWIKFFLLLLNFSIIILTLTIKSSHSLKVINDILEIDKEISDYCGGEIILMNDCAFTTRTLFGMCLLILYIILLNVYHLTSSDFYILCLIIIEYVVLIIIIMVMLFISGLLRIVTVRYAFVNHTLNHYGYEQQRLMLNTKVSRRRVYDLVSMENFPEDSEFVFRLHNKLLEIQGNINDFCNFLLIVFIILTFYLVTASTYSIFLAVSDSKNNTYILVQHNFVNIIIFTTLLGIVCRVCGQVSEEANRISEIVARIYSNVREHRKIIDRFLTKRIKQKIEFTAYGFFAINNAVFFKVFTAAATYLVILIQSKQLEDSKLEYQN